MRNRSSIDSALAEGLFRGSGQSNRASDSPPLSARQIDILKLVAQGTRYRNISAQLFISETTVNREMRNIFNQLGANDAPHAIAEAYRRRLL